jgi:hypothetical protein
MYLSAPLARDPGPDDRPVRLRLVVVFPETAGLLPDHVTAPMAAAGVSLRLDRLAAA